MIDFRYHLVSLISVFLALAVGIILGAGPLQGAIGDQLTGQVDQLREERNTLRSDLDNASATSKNQSEFIAAAGPRLVAGSLTGRRVAIIDLDGANAERDEAVSNQLDTAGAQVVGHVKVAESWTDPDDEGLRKTIANGFGDLIGSVATDATPDQRLSRALAISLTGASPANSDLRSDDAMELEDQLKRFGLIDLVSEQTLPADVIVLMSGSAPAEATPAPTPSAKPDTSVVDAELTIASAAQDVSKAALVVGPTAASGDLISAIRGNKAIAANVSTVSGAETLMGRINVPLALAARLMDQVGQYGTDSGATAVMPPAVTLPPVERQAAGTPEPTSTPAG